MRRAVSTTGQMILGALLLVTGTAHLTFARAEFQAQVPSWMPVDENVVVVVSGVVELCLAVALLATWRQPARAIVGVVTAAFFIAILPGNIAQFTEHRDGFGLNTDAARAIRLLFQPLLVLWALAVTSAVATIRHRRYGERAGDDQVARGDGAALPGQPVTGIGEVRDRGRVR